MFKKYFILSLIVASAATNGLYANDNGHETYADLYEARVKRAKATPDTKDDLALATELLDAAQQAKELPGLVKLLCENSEELVRSSADGYEAGVAAMRLLVQVVPEQRTKANERLIKLAEQRFASSDPTRRFEGGDYLLDLLIEDYTSSTCFSSATF